MSEPDGSLRIGAAEREAALAALTTHQETGRLSSAEHEDRALKVGQARTWADLAALFADLPEPRPAAPRPVTPYPAAPRQPQPFMDERWARTLVALAPIIAVVLFFTTGTWLWFLLIPAVSIVVYGGKGRR